MNLSFIFNIGKSHITDMAIGRSLYETKCLSVLNPVLTHLCKICVFPNGNIKHWKDEIFSFIYPLIEFDVKNDNKACRIKRKCLRGIFAEGLLGEGFKDYHKIRSYFVIAIRNEGFSEKQFDIDEFVEENKDRFIDFFNNISDFDFTKSEEAKKDLLDDIIDNFAENKN